MNELTEGETPRGSKRSKRTGGRFWHGHFYGNKKAVSPLKNGASSGVQKKLKILFDDHGPILIVTQTSAEASRY